MNHSKYGLNAPFYKWLDDVRRAIRKEQELRQKLEYYNVKFMGYQGITYDRIGSSSRNNSKGDQNMLYWLDKIDQTQIELNRYNSFLLRSKRFTTLLTDIEESYFICLISDKNVRDTGDRSQKSRIMASIARKWFMHYNI